MNGWAAFGNILEQQFDLITLNGRLLGKKHVKGKTSKSIVQLNTFIKCTVVYLL